ncbi:histone deacetylase complex subunit SAP30L-like protein, partial [Cricetulus griseus]
SLIYSASGSWSSMHYQGWTPSHDMGLKSDQSLVVHSSWVMHYISSHHILHAGKTEDNNRRRKDNRVGVIQKDEQTEDISSEMINSAKHMKSFALISVVLQTFRIILKFYTNNEYLLDGYKFQVRGNCPSIHNRIEQAPGESGCSCNCSVSFGTLAELDKAVLQSSSSSDNKEKLIGGLTNPVTIWAQNQGYELAHPNIYLFCELLEHVQETNLQTKASGPPQHKTTGYLKGTTTVNIDIVAEARGLEKDQPFITLASNDTWLKVALSPNTKDITKLFLVAPAFELATLSILCFKSVLIHDLHCSVIVKTLRNRFHTGKGRAKHRADSIDHCCLLGSQKPQPVVSGTFCVLVLEKFDLGNQDVQCYQQEQYSECSQNLGKH